MRWLIASSLKFRLLVVLIAGGLMIIGTVQLRNSSVDVLPEFSAPSVQIQTEALGLSAVEVEQLITVPLEADFLAGMPWLDDITSESVPGLSSIEMVFKPGTDVLRARQMVQERLSQAFVLPNVSTPPVMIQPISSTNRVLMVGLSSKGLSQIELSVLSRWIIKPRLMGVPGVANVAVWGNRERQLQVQVDPEKLKQRGVTLDQIISTTGNALWVSPLTFVEASTPGTGGFVETPSQRLGIQHISPITKAGDLAQVTIEGQADGRRLRLGDVSQVVEDHQPLIGDALVDNGPGLMMVVEKFPGANTLDVTKGVEQALESLRPGLKGVEINTDIYRPATFIDKALHNLAIALIVAGVLLLLVLVGFLLNWRTTLICLVAVLVSLTTTGLVLHLARQGLNAMVLAGIVLAIAFVIADAVGDVHNIAQRLQRNRESGSEEPAWSAILAASLEVRRPMAYATLCALLAAAPVLFLPDLTGLFFRPLAVTFIIAVVASMLVALTVTPALALLLLRNAPAARRDSPLLRWPQRWYSGWLARVFSRPAVAYALAGVIVLAGLLVGLTQPLGRSTIPMLADRNLLVHWDAVAGTSGPEMIRLTEKAGRELRMIPGVSDVGTHVGRAITSDQVVGANSAEIWVAIDPAADYQATRAAIQSTVADYPGVNTRVQSYPEARIREVLGSSADDVIVRIYGQDLKVLNDKAKEVQQMLSSVDNLADVRTVPLVEEPTVQVRVDLAKAEKYGLKPGDVRRAAAALISGVQAGSLFEEQKVFEVVVWGIPAIRNSLSGIRGLLIDTPDGGQVRLGDVADVHIAPTPSVIRHDSISRFVDVSARVKSGNIDSIVGDIDSKLAKISFPNEYHAELVGDYSERQQNRYRVLVLGLAALIGILLLIQVAVDGWLLAAVLVLTLPIAVAGGLLLGLISGITALTSTVAIVAVVGFAARTSIQMVGGLRQLEHEEGRTLNRDLVQRGAQEQLVPILITTVAIAAVVLPLLILSGEGSEVARPIALIVLGGVITSALVNLFIVPALYLRFGARRPDTEVAMNAQPGLG